uniref:Histone deacetylase complex subunit SAP130 C-terminal domain-containing protein n=1 Tax=Ascaris lumbricoides TaxID=6252 RepID=A0A9J2PF46_ASCLU
MKVKKKSGGCCSYSPKTPKKYHTEKRKKAKQSIPKPQPAAQPQPMVVPAPAILMPTVQSQPIQELKAEAGDVEKPILPQDKTSRTATTTTDVSTPKPVTKSMTKTAKDNDEVDVETDGTIEQPQQSFVMRKYVHEGRTIRYFDHKMSYPAEDRPESFFPPTIKKFLAYQRCMKGVPLKEQNEAEKKLVSNDEAKSVKNLEDLEGAVRTLRALIQQIKVRRVVLGVIHSNRDAYYPEHITTRRFQDRVEKLTPQLQQCADDMDSGVNQMAQLLERMIVNNEASKKS